MYVSVKLIYNEYIKPCFFLSHVVFTIFVNDPSKSRFLLYITVFDIKMNHQRFQTTPFYASHCHHCNQCHYSNDDFVLFHNVTCYTCSLLSCIHVNST